MKKNLFSLGALGMIALFAACTQAPKGYTVEGTLPDSTMNGETVYMQNVDTREVVDSTVVDGDRVVFTGVASDTAQLCQISIARHLASLVVLENGNIQVDFENGASPKGTALNDEISRIYGAMDSINVAYQQARQAFTGTADEWAEAYKNEWLPRFEELTVSSYVGHTDDAVGYCLLDLLSSMDADKQLEIVNTFGPWLSSTKRVSAMKEALEAQQKTAVGQPYVDITGTDAEGNAVSLSDYVGKGNYVLVDMWASWCGPCRREIPNLANVHNLYKDKGLTVLGIYVWDKMENFAPALEAEKITWPQIIDSNETATKLYGVRGIPCIMLIGPDGTILDRTNLRGDNMQPTVEKFMFGK